MYRGNHLVSREQGQSYKSVQITKSDVDSNMCTKRKEMGVCPR